MKDILISVENVSKKFCSDRYLQMKYGLIDVFNNLWVSKKIAVKLRKKEFFGIENVSFSLNRGECLGVLGPNGAGKTTLLKLIMGVLMPDTGRITVNGKIAGILDFRSGLSMELTGRENIYFSCSLYNKNKSEIAEMFNSIVEAAELEKFIDSPLKTYSSGMVARLVFSIAIHLQPDILLVDDVLFAGDIKFQEKTEYILNQIRGNSVIVFASHSMDALLAQASKILIVDGGKVKFIGEKVRAVDYYYQMIGKSCHEQIITGSGDVDLSECVLKSNKEDSVNKCNYGDEINISFKIKPRKNLKDYTIICAIIAKNNVPIIKSEVKNKFGILELGEEKTINIFINNVQLVPGKYSISLRFYDNAENQLLRAIKNAIIFQVKDGPIGVCPLNIDYVWSVK